MVEPSLAWLAPLQKTRSPSSHKTWKLPCPYVPNGLDGFNCHPPALAPAAQRPAAFDRQAGRIRFKSAKCNAVLAVENAANRRAAKNISFSYQ
jgi:hypothetical protein